MSTTNQELDRLLAAAAQAQQAGNLQTAEQLSRDALKLDPTCVTAKFLLGILLARRGDLPSACDLLKDVVAADPRSYQALVSLSTIQLDLGHFEEAIELARRVVKLQPGEAQAHNHLGRALLAARRLDEAAMAFRTAIALRPDFAPAFHNLGKTVQWEGKDREAAEAFTRAAQLAPVLENLIPLGQTLLTLCEFQGAEECARFTLTRYPDAASAHLLLCGALIGLGQLETAETHLQMAIALDKEGREALQIAERQRPLGHIEEANENLRRAIALNPRHVSAYDSLMHNQKVTERDRPLVDQMMRLLEDGSMSPTELISIHYGLGKALEDLGEFEAAMRHLDEANRISRKVKIGDIAFDRERYTEHVDRQIQVYTQCSRQDQESSLPILVVGMMRSGTTLAEQILSSHPKVAPAGEQLYWALNWTRAATDGPAALKQLGEEYLEVLRTIGPDADRVVDKMPGNYHFAGLIHLALPNARILHMRRSPADTCLSVWATPNHMPPEGGHDKAATVFVYQEYMRMMEYWRGVLPADRFLEVDYESLVSNREEITRQMVAFCGLEWDDACLSPEKNDRLVTTPSLWQVRQPVYKTSVARWKKFEPWLGAFAELVEIAHPPIEG